MNFSKSQVTPNHHMYTEVGILTPQVALLEALMTMVDLM